MAVDIAPELYDEIQRRFQEKLNRAERSGSHVRDIRRKLEAGTATFRDADLYAVEVGSMLSDSMMEVLQLNQMPNGQFYYNIAKRTLGQSLQDGYGLVSSVAAEVQEELNTANGIGLKAITPEANKERINGLVDKAVEALDQEALNKILSAPVEIVLMSAVDDTVKTNAQYQSKAGLQPIIRRATVSKCCNWCEALAGTYKYPDNVPKDVYRRHQNCRCTVEYIGAGKRQDVWSKKEDVLTREEAESIEQNILNSTGKQNALRKEIISIYGADIPGKGAVSRELGYKTSKHQKEISCADWLVETFGGDVKLLKESNEAGVKTPDYLWKGRLWEHKTASSINSIDKQLQTGIQQIAKNPGGVIIELEEANGLTSDEIHNAITNRIKRKEYQEQIKVVVKKGNDIIDIIKH